MLGLDSLGYFVVSFSVGIAGGALLDFVWRTTGISKYERRLEVFEHYHWGLLFLILVKTLLGFIVISFSFAGAGITLIVTEITQNHPFALKSNHQKSSSAIGIIFLFLTIFIWLR